MKIFRVLRKEKYKNPKCFYNLSMARDVGLQIVQTIWGSSESRQSHLFIMSSRPDESMTMEM